MDIHIPRRGEADICRRCKEHTPIIARNCDKPCNHYTSFVLNDAKFQILRRLDNGQGEE